MSAEDIAFNIALHNDSQWNLNLTAEMQTAVLKQILSNRNVSSTRLEHLLTSRLAHRGIVDQGMLVHAIKTQNTDLSKMFEPFYTGKCTELLLQTCISHDNGELFDTLINVHGPVFVSIETLKKWHACAKSDHFRIKKNISEQIRLATLRSRCL